MRKRTVKYCYDTILWGIITLLPLILYVGFIFFYLGGERELSIGNVSALSGDLSFFTVMHDIYDWFGVGSYLGNNFIYQAFYSIFNGQYIGYIDGSFQSMVLWYASYVIMVELLHICVDLILLLPRICRKFLDKFKSEE